MKKVIGIVLSAMMAISLTACSSTTDNTAQTQSESQTTAAVTSQAKGTEAKGTEEKQKPVKIGVSAPDLTNVFFIQIKEAMQKSLQNPEDELILLNSKAADYVVTGCGTGQGAMLALNSFPGVICGLVTDPSDGYMFAQINDGNAIAMPFAKGFGWGAELNLEYAFEKLFSEESGQGYPRERAVPEQRNKKILDGVRENNLKDLITCLKGLDQDLVKGALSGEKFKELFFANCKDASILEYVKSLLA